VSFTAESLLDRLDEFTAQAGAPARYVIALSGGLDSAVLTHALATSSARHGVPILAVHVDHGLHRESAAWATHCEALAAELGIEFMVRRVTVDLNSGRGLEAAARQARYAALRSVLEAGDWLLSGHHQDDQAETVLLNLMRSSGPAGLAGISACRHFAVAWLIRPMLEVPRSDLQTYAEAHGLETISDPSNLDQQFDRNYLRHDVLPRLEARWPDAAKRMRRSAELAREAATLLGELAAADRQRLGDRPDRLDLGELRSLSPARQRNVLRHSILDAGLPMPGAANLQRILADIIGARDDAQPLVAWPGARARRYRNALYLQASDGLEPPAPERLPVTASHVPLPAGLGALVFETDADLGLSEAAISAGLELRFRVGGEEIKPVDHKHTKKLKKLLQEAGVVPWMREQLPLVYAGGELVAVADLWLAASAASRPGTAIRWQNRPAIH
jgi:tRNA(Ile)-lysidine synthase